MFVATAAAALALAGLVAETAAVCGSSSGTPLIQQSCPWPYSGPEQIDTSDGPRGLMQGINRCNATTQNQQSQCVNAVANNASTFCLYGPPTLDSIANDEGETVAYCSQTGFGTRLLTAGTIQGLQVVRTPGYIAFGGQMDQTQINILANDSGGELDPHGADNRGNPIGSLFYSTAFSANGSYEQITEWHMFVGSNQFCFKLCNPSYNNAGGNLCLNIYDTVGCNGNVPLNYAAINGTFTSCQGDNQEVPNGSSLPIPATSSCVTYQSSQLFAALPTGSASASASASASSSASLSMLTSAPSSGSTGTSTGTSSRTTGAITSSTGTTSSSQGSAMSAIAYSSTLQGGLMIVGSLIVGAAVIVL